MPTGGARRRAQAAPRSRVCASFGIRRALPLYRGVSLLQRGGAISSAVRAIARGLTMACQMSENGPGCDQGAAHEGRRAVACFLYRDSPVLAPGDIGEVLADGALDRSSA